MNLFPIIVIFAIIIALIVIATTRKRLKSQVKELSEQIEGIHLNEDLHEQAPSVPTKSFVNIPTDIGEKFANQFISAEQTKTITEHYTPYYQEAIDLKNRISFFEIDIPATITNFMRDFCQIDTIIQQHNNGVIHHLLETHKKFFDTCLQYPLDPQQRRSIVSLEDNCLVVSSAGSGKTSSIVGKVKYLTDILNIAPQRILLISYTNKAAAELTDRMATKGLNGYTFHKLALEIIGQTTGIKPSICDNTDALFVAIYHDLLKDPAFKSGVLRYFTDYQVEEADWERKKNERRDQLSEAKSHVARYGWQGYICQKRSRAEDMFYSIFARSKIPIRRGVRTPRSRCSILTIPPRFFDIFQL